MRSTQPSILLSPDVYRLIDSSRRLREALAPESLTSSPYEVLDYAGVLILHDAKGRKSTFRRTERVRFLQNGVRSLVDHLWGDGLLIEYHNDAGAIGDSIRDGRYRHLVIDMPRAVKVGAVLTFRTSRVNLGMFPGPTESWEITIDHPVGNFSQVVVFPVERPCLEGQLWVNGYGRRIEVVHRRDGRTALVCDVPFPIMNAPYLIQWRW